MWSFGIVVVWKVFVPSDNCRGYRINGCLIDENIAQDIKNCILRPIIVPRLVEIDGVSKFEDRLETNKRIVEVKI